MLELKHLSYRYQQKALLDNVNLTIAPGQTIALLGPSGSGKSTLLRLTAGLTRPDQGTVWWNHQDITSWPPERRRFGLMFQDFALFPHLNVRDNVAFGPREQGIGRTAARAQAELALSEFGLIGRGSDRVDQLSGGEQQRVALARAMVTQPRVMLLDEPFSALDTALKERLRAEFKTRFQEKKIAALLVTHDEADAHAMADDIYELKQGQLVMRSSI